MEFLILREPVRFISGYLLYRFSGVKPPRLRMLAEWIRHFNDSAMGENAVRAPLMIELRLIERKIVQIEPVMPQIEKDEKADPVFVDKAVDFIRTVVETFNNQ